MPWENLSRVATASWLACAARGQPADAVGDGVKLQGIIAQKTVFVFRTDAADVSQGKGAELH
jgi:hypothetical protein